MHKIYSILFLTIGSCIFIISCNSQFINIVSDVQSSYYFTETYNATSDMQINLKTFENIYSNKTIYLGADILLSNKIPPVELQKSLIEISKKKNDTYIIQNPNTTTSLVAFSIPLIVSLKNPDKEMPQNKRISQTDMLTHINKATTNTKKNIWAFPLKVDENFIQTFTNTKKYEQWMEKVISNTEVNRNIFKTHYHNVSHIAMLQDPNITYKFTSSHIFFSQPHEWRELFSVAVLTDNNGMVPIITPIFISGKKSNSYWHSKTIHSIFTWLTNENNQKNIFTFTQQLFEQISLRTQFLERSYSNNKNFTIGEILPRNSWLAKYGPDLSFFYWAPKQ